MKAVILAAGRGTRLEPLTADIPKSLVEVGGVTLLDRMMDRLEAVGVDSLVVVSGHGHDRVEAHLAASTRTLAAGAKVVFNDKYAEWGNFYSLFVAQDMVWDHDFVALDGDVLLGPNVLPALMAAGGDLVLAVDRTATLGEEEMKVRLDDRGRAVELNKRMAPSAAAGEFIGIELVRAPMVPSVFGELRAMVDDQEHDEYYERAFERLMEQGTEVAIADVSGSVWCEIDDARDLELANQIAGRGDA